MTQRTKAALDTLFANNTTGLITPAYLRDFVDSIKPSWGAIHFLDTVTPTVIATQSTFTKISNVGDLMSGSNRYTMPSDGRLTYGGSESVTTRVAFSGTILSAGNNETIRVAIGVNGTVSTPSIMITKLGSASDQQSIALLVDLVLAPSDYLEVFVSNDSSAADLTMVHGYLTALGFMT